MEWVFLIWYVLHSRTEKWWREANYKIKKGFGVSLQQYPLVGVIKKFFNKSSHETSFQDGRHYLSKKPPTPPLPPWNVVNTDFTDWSGTLEKEHCMGGAGLRGVVFHTCFVQVSQNVWQRWQYSNVINFEVLLKLFWPLDLKSKFNQDGGQDTDPQSRDHPNVLFKWTTQMGYPRMDYP